MTLLDAQFLSFNFLEIYNVGVFFTLGSVSGSKYECYGTIELPDPKREDSLDVPITFVKNTNKEQTLLPEIAIKTNFSYPV